MKTVLLAPGFRQGPDSINYRGAIKAIENKGYKVKFIPIKWAYTTLKDWVSQLEQSYARLDPNDTILAGFSYGSLTTLVAAGHRPPSELWLFSLSPYFADDLSCLKPSWLKSKRRRAEFQGLNLRNFSNIKNIKVLLFLGEAEAKRYPFVKKRTMLAKGYFKNSILIMVPKAGHDIGDPNYISAISKNIG
jgi:hypothetical protein